MSGGGGGGGGGTKGSGPTPGDPGLGGFMAGGGGTASGFDAPVGDPSSGFNAANTPPTGSSIAAAPPPMPATSVGFGGTFDAGGGTALPGTGGGSNPVTASLGTPQGITSAPAPVGAAPLPGVTGPTDLSNYYDPSNPGSSPLSGAPTGGGTTTELSAQQLGAPKVTPSSPANATAGGTATNNQPSVLDSLGIKNPLGAAIGAGGLAYAAIEGQHAPKYSPELLAQAKSLNAQGQQLLSYLSSGNLPPGLKASLDQATAAAKAKVISNFAAQGMNTDPAQNTALAQTLLQIDQQALISTAQMGQQLLQSGIAESGLSSDLYKTLANIDQTQTASIGKAIANFASALSGGGGGINLNLGKA